MAKGEIQRRVGGVIRFSTARRAVRVPLPRPTERPASSSASRSPAPSSSPSVLLLDEPPSNLDAKLRAQVRGEIRQVQQALHITTVFVTHDQAEASNT